MSKMPELPEEVELELEREERHSFSLDESPRVPLGWTTDQSLPDTLRFKELRAAIAGAIGQRDSEIAGQEAVIVELHKLDAVAAAAIRECEARRMAEIATDIWRSTGLTNDSERPDDRWAVSVNADDEYMLAIEALDALRNKEPRP